MSACLPATTGQLVSPFGLLWVYGNRHLGTSTAELTTLWVSGLADGDVELWIFDTEPLLGHGLQEGIDVYGLIHLGSAYSL